MVKRLLYRKVPRKTSTSFSHRSASCPQRTWSIGKINWEPYRLSSTHRMRVDSSEKGFFAKCFNLGMLSIRVYYTVILLCEGISKKRESVRKLNYTLGGVNESLGSGRLKAYLSLVSFLSMLEVGWFLFRKQIALAFCSWFLHAADNIDVEARKKSQNAGCQKYINVIALPVKGSILTFVLDYFLNNYATPVKRKANKFGRKSFACDRFFIPVQQATLNRLIEKPRLGSAVTRYTINRRLLIARHVW